MRLPASLLTLAALAVEWVASSPASSKSTGNKSENAHSGSQLPVANHTTLHGLGGPEIGALAAVNRHLFCSKDIFSDLVLPSRLRQPGSLPPTTTSARFWMMQFMPSSRLNMLRTSLETSSLEDSQKASMTVIFRELGAPARFGTFKNNGTSAADTWWPAINLDLQWIYLHWNESSYEVWLPPVWAGNSYLQYRTLKYGANTFWNGPAGWIADTTVTDVATGGQSGISYISGYPLYWVTYNSAEQLLDTLITWDLIGELQVTKRSHKFFQQFDEQVKIGTYRRGPSNAFTGSYVARFRKYDSPGAITCSCGDPFRTAEHYCATSHSAYPRPS
ncbi:hypothetical protein EDB89DRAFT_1909422 [Lactarius sanguifluus]|nr:hypothetical protein EDB89DRAFT_1909422 [Lactarius sanguifluus]